VREEVTRDIEVRPSSVALWCGIFAGPVAWAINLQLNYALARWACERGSQAAPVAISSILFVVAILGLLFSWRALRVVGHTEVSTRVRFMAIGGMLLSAIFALTILASLVPHLYLSPCE
jgi:hypothetical protein